MDEFQSVDEAALATPRDAERDLDTLARHLQSLGRNDTCKARAIYRWLADRVVYDAAGYLSDNIPDQAPEVVILRRTAVCQGFADTFNALAQRAGLTSVVVSGEARYSSSFDSILKFKHRINARTQRPLTFVGALKSIFVGRVRESNHAWNAVRIGDQWHLIDCTWGAGFLDGSHYHKKFTALYFWRYGLLCG